MTRSEFAHTLRCPRCEYSLLGLSGDEIRDDFAVTCPECGLRVTNRSLRRNPDHVPLRMAPFVFLPGVGLGALAALLGMLIPRSNASVQIAALASVFGVITAVLCAAFVAQRMNRQYPPAGPIVTRLRFAWSWIICMLTTIVLFMMSAATTAFILAKLLRGF